MNDAETPKPETPEPLKCSFCLLPLAEVGRLVKSSGGVCICDACVVRAVELLVKRPKE